MACSQELGDLNGEGTHASAAAIDKHRIPRLEVRGEAFPGGDSGGANCGALAEGHILRKLGYTIRYSQCIFCQCPMLIGKIQVAEDAVTYFEIGSQAVGDLGDDSGIV